MSTTRTGIRLAFAVLVVAAVAAVVPGTARGVPPANTAPPSISGTATAGQTLTAAPGTWTGASITYTYEWRRCNASGGACAPIAGATSTTYVLAAADVGSTVLVAVTATNADGNATAVSAPTAVVAAAPQPPANTVLPSISGTAATGQTLSASPGTWTGASITYTYEWRRCDATGAGCAAIAGATSTTYAPVAADVGATIRVAVTAANSAGTATAVSPQTAVVVAPPQSPANTVLPLISGTAATGQTLSASPGTWSGSPTTTSYEWRRCDATGAGCAAIAGATSATYAPVVADIGATIRVAVTAANAAGSATAVSSQTAVVVDGSPPSLSLGSPADGAKLTTNVTFAATGVSDDVGVTAVIFRFCDSTAAACLPAGGSTIAGSNGGGGRWTATPASTALVDGHSYTWDAVASDASGNTTTAATRSFVIDRTVPALVLPGPIAVSAPGPSGTTVSFSVSGSDDGQPLPPASITCQPASGSLFAVGTTSVACTTSPDPAGNVGSGSFTVTVTYSPPSPPPAAARGGGGSTSPPARSGTTGSALTTPPATTSGGTSGGSTSTPATGGSTDTGSTAPATSKTGDTRPPANPGNLAAKPGPGWIQLSWTLPTAKDFDHVEVFRTGARATAQSAGKRVYRGKASSFTDRGLRATMRYRYVVESVDTAGNRSAGAVVVASPRIVMLTAPGYGATVKRLPVLRWRAKAGATYYNVQLFRGEKKVLSAWPSRVTLKLAASWKYQGKRYKLTPGTYRWYVWPGIGARAKGKYGNRLGDSRFVVPKRLELTTVAAATGRRKVSISVVRAKPTERGTVRVTVAITGWKVNRKHVSHATARSGYWLISVDGRPNARSRKAKVGLTKKLKPGRHTIRAELVHENGKHIKPRARSARVRVTVPKR